MSNSGMGRHGPTPPDGRGQRPGTFGGPRSGDGRTPSGSTSHPGGTFGGPPPAAGYEPGGQAPAAQGGYGAPVGPGLPSGYGGPGGPGSYGGPGAPGGPTGPDNVQSGPPPKRPLAIILVALGCIGALVLMVGGGITFLLLSGDDEEESAAPSPELQTSAASTPTPGETTTETTEPAETTEPVAPGFEVLSPLDVPQGDNEEIWAIMEDNPLTAGSLPAIGSCELPETAVDHSKEELQAALEAAGGCLNEVWATASSDRDLPWHSPTVEVYTWPEVPADASCDPGSFEEGFPRVCNLDRTIYWPAGYGTGAEQSDTSFVATSYLWDLSYMYMLAVVWNSSLSTYFSTLSELVEDDSELQAEAWRRYNLQMQCLSSAASMRMPEQARPAQEFRDALLDEANWNAGAPPRSIEPASRVHWISQGLGADGDTSACNTWSAPADQVA